jgi:histidine triad (HIT) family protein
MRRLSLCVLPGGSNRSPAFSASLLGVACLFCRIIARDAAAHLVLDEPDAVAFLDARPVFKGHVLVVPREHIVTLTDVPPDGLAPLFATVQRVAAAVVRAFEAQGSFVAMNNVVSQSVPHLHVHVVPRTKGDGLRGFFWPRTRYADDTEAGAHAAKVREALALAS